MVCASSPEIDKQPFGHGSGIRSAAQPGILDHRHGFAEQRPQAEIGAETGQRGAGHVVHADKAANHPRNRPFAASFRADQQQDFLLPGVGRQKVADPLLQRADALADRRAIARPGTRSQAAGSGACTLKSKSRQFGEKNRGVGGVKWSLPATSEGK